MSLSDHEVASLVEVDSVKRATLVRDFMRRIDQLPRQQRADELLDFLILHLDTIGMARW